jgi:hypothetical protein
LLKIYSSEHAALVGWDHVLDVDVSVFTTMLLEKLKGLLDQLTCVVFAFLVVVNFISYVHYEGSLGFKGGLTISVFE